MALSTSAAVTGFATSMFGAVNNLLGISDPANVPEDLGTALDMSDIKISNQFKKDFERILYIARATQKASTKLDDLIEIDKRRVYDVDRISHFLEKVRSRSS